MKLTTIALLAASIIASACSTSKTEYLWGDGLPVTSGLYQCGYAYKFIDPKGIVTDSFSFPKTTFAIVVNDHSPAVGLAGSWTTTNEPDGNGSGSLVINSDAPTLGFFGAYRQEAMGNITPGSTGVLSTGNIIDVYAYYLTTDSAGLPVVDGPQQAAGSDVQALWGIHRVQPPEPTSQAISSPAISMTEALAKVQVYRDVDVYMAQQEAMGAYANGWVDNYGITYLTRDDLHFSLVLQAEGQP